MKVKFVQFTAVTYTTRTLGEGTIHILVLGMDDEGNIWHRLINPNSAWKRCSPPEYEQP